MAEDFLPILGTDHIEFYVGNARGLFWYNLFVIALNL